MKLLSGEILANKKYGSSLYKLEVFSPYICRNAIPGQFVEVKCSTEDATDPLLRRPFGIYEIDKRFNVFSLLYIVRGKGTAFLSRMEKGQNLDFIGPLGNGLKLDLDDGKKYILIGGGIGIAPLCLAAAHLAEKEKEILFIAGFKDNVFFSWEKDIAKITQNYRIFTEDGSFGEKGLPTSYLAANIKKLNNSTIIACGPSDMLRVIQEILVNAHGFTALSLLEERMACGIGACMGCVIKIKEADGTVVYKKVCSDGPVFNLMEVIFE